jgi:RNA polymerase sigma-70 factor (ECF subfamily)
MTNEQLLIANFRAGDTSAFDEIVRNQQKAVYMLALRLLNDSEEALEVSQNAFIRAYHGLKDFRGDASLSTWLYRITYNLCLRKLRANRLRRFFTLESEDYAIPDIEHPDTRLEHQEFQRDLQLALAKLPPQQKAVFTLHHLQGLKLAEVARVMKRDIGTVKALHYHAVRKMRTALKEWREEE